jgi:hypothetical protein
VRSGLDDLGKVRQAVGQTINLVHDDRVDQAFFDIFKQALEPGLSVFPPE